MSRSDIARQLFSFEGTAPTVHESAFIAPGAVLIGDVTIEEGASVWPNAVLRADYAPIVVRRGANIQDGSVLHGGSLTEIGPGATVGHLCVVHGATVGEEALIGNGATVLDGAVIGARSLVAAQSMVAAGASFGEGLLIAGAPAVAKKPLEGTGAAQWVAMNPSAYRELARRYNAGLAPVVGEG